MRRRLKFGDPQSIQFVRECERSLPLLSRTWEERRRNRFYRGVPVVESKCELCQAAVMFGQNFVSSGARLHARCMEELRQLALKLREEFGSASRMGD